MSNIKDSSSPSLVKNRKSYDIATLIPNKAKVIDISVSVPLKTSESILSTPSQIIPELSSNNNNNPVVLLIDYDDTILPTSEIIDQSNPFPVHSAIDNIIKSNLKWSMISYDATILDTLDHFVLKKYVLLQNIFIVTNSGSPWIKQSASSLLPLSYNKVLNQIKTLYRTNEMMDMKQNVDMNNQNAVESMYCEWKIRNIRRIIQQYPNGADILCIGDGIYEHIAIQCCMTECTINQSSKYRLRMLKMRESPTIKQLHFQWVWIYECCHWLFNFDKQEHISIEQLALISQSPPNWPIVCSAYEHFHYMHQQTQQTQQKKYVIDNKHKHIPKEPTQPVIFNNNNNNNVSFGYNVINWKPLPMSVILPGIPSSSSSCFRPLATTINY